MTEKFCDMNEFVVTCDMPSESLVVQYRTSLSDDLAWARDVFPRIDIGYSERRQVAIALGRG